VSLDGTIDGPLPWRLIVRGFLYGRWHADALVFVEAPGRWTPALGMPELAAALRVSPGGLVPPRINILVGGLAFLAGLATFGAYLNLVRWGVLSGFARYAPSPICGSLLAVGGGLLWRGGRAMRAARIARDAPSRQDPPPSETRP